MEDEPPAAMLLEFNIAQVPFLELVGTFKDAILAMEYLRTETVDLIFLDIHLPKLRGISFLKTLKNPPSVIITTAYHEYAVESYELNVVDYLLKPFEFDRFLVAVNKVNTQSQQRGPAEARPIKDFLIVSVQLKKVKIMFAEILYIESQKEYIKIVTDTGTYTTKISTHEIEGLLPAHLFKRIHRSFIVSINKIRTFNSEMVEIKGVSIPIGRGYKDFIDSL